METELWNIFTYYTLHGDPLDPEHIKLTQFVRLCKDCEILGQQGLSSPDINVLYRSEVTRGHAAKRAEAKARAMNEGYKARAGTGVVANDKMNFNCFLNAIMKLSSLVRACRPRRPRPRLTRHCLPVTTRRRSTRLPRASTTPFSSCSWSTCCRSPRAASPSTWTSSWPTLACERCLPSSTRR